MWFKNARIYTVELDENTKQLFANEGTFEERIAIERFKPMGAQESSAFGFSPVFGANTEAFSFVHDHNYLLRFTEERKLCPAEIVKQAFADELQSKEQELNRTLTHAEKSALKTAVINKMMERAFVSRRELFMWVNTRYGFAAVSTSSAKRAEQAIMALRKALGSFPAKPFQPRCVVEDRLTSFITNGELPESLTLGSDAVLKATDDSGSTVRISKDDLTTDEVLSLIKAGKVVTELQLNFNHCAKLVLSAELVLKRVSLDDQFLEKNMPQTTGDPVADMQANVILESDVLTNLLGQIAKTFDCDRG